MRYEPVPSDITVTEEFSAARDILEQGEKHLFLTGRAGTGKSTFLRYFRERTAKNVAVLAPTGVAALNIRGQTIHSFFRFPPAFLEPGRERKGAPERRRLYRSLDILVIDEISMTRADLFDAVEEYLRKHGKRPGEPFGGVKLCVIGDLYQLPPVVTGRDAEVFYEYYHAPYFFCARAYDPDAFAVIELTKIFRQSEDERGYIRFLDGLRKGTLHEADIDAFNKRTVGKRFGEEDAYVTLTAVNRKADAINDRELRALPGEAVTYQAEAKGTFTKLQEDGARLPAPAALTLKPGARVMFLRNDAQRRWANGTSGTVTKAEPEQVTVSVNGDEYNIERESWDDIRYGFDPKTEEVTEDKAGSFTQFPLQPAWAVTIHKSQSKTYDKALIDFAGGAFAPGQAYVALSRCRSIEGVALVSPLTRRDIRVDEKVNAFFESCLPALSA